MVMKFEFINDQQISITDLKKACNFDIACRY